MPSPIVGRRISGQDVERIEPGTTQWALLYSEHVQRYELAAGQMKPGARVLDAGCGVGYGSALLADRGAANVVAVDISAEAIEIGRRQFARDTILWVTEDCQDLTEAGRHGPFDLICNLENLEHLAEPARFLARVTSLLRDGGTLISSTPNRIGMNRLRGVPPEARPVNPFHFREYTAAEFEVLLRNYFEEVTLSFQTFDPIERMHYEPVLSALWRNPAVRLGRWAHRWVRRQAVQLGPEELIPPRRYQILPTNPGDALVITQLATCRTPRR
jgi:SAM-dependent methyltransferase